MGEHKCILWHKSILFVSIRDLIHIFHNTLTRFCTKLSFVHLIQRSEIGG
jgi:hypothetical protein